LKDEVVYAEAVVKAKILKKSGGSVAPAEILELIGISTPAPTLPLWIQRWAQNSEISQ